jgi:hypothetical protein
VKESGRILDKARAMQEIYTGLWIFFTKSKRVKEGKRERGKEGKS